MEETKAAPPANGGEAQKETGWDPDNVRLGIFLLLLAVWAPMQFVPLVGDTYCKGKEALFIFSFPLILLALFLSKRRTPQTLFRLTAWAMLFAGFILANYISDGKLHLPSSEYQLAVLAGSLYFVKQRILWDHGKNFALLAVALFFLSIRFRWPNVHLYVAAIAVSLTYMAFKWNEGLLRPALLIIVALVSFMSWDGAMCMESGQSRYCYKAKSDLANMALHEDAYYAGHAIYTDDIKKLGKFKQDKNVTIYIKRASKKSFRAMAFHPQCGDDGNEYLSIFYWDSANGGLQ